MNRRALLAAGLCALMVSASGCSGGPKGVISTSLGEIIVEVFEEEAPITAANFLRYVDDGLYEGGSFYRVVRMDNQPNSEVKIEVIQGGRRGLPRDEGFPAIGHETTETTGVLHLDGVISMARSSPGTATSEIFICIGDQPELDFGGRRNPDGQGFAAFGKVVRGMDVVREIQQQQAPRLRLQRVLAFEVEHPEQGPGGNEPHCAHKQH